MKGYLHLVECSVCRFKSLLYYRHLAASQLFRRQLAEARRTAGASYLPSKRLIRLTLKFKVGD